MHMVIKFYAVSGRQNIYGIVIGQLNVKDTRLNQGNTHRE